MGPVLALFNPIQPKQPLDKYERARNLLSPENKSCLTQCVNLKYIKKNLTLIEIWAFLAQFNPVQPKQPLDKYERARYLLSPENKSHLNQYVNFKDILNLTLIVIGPILAQFNPVQLKQLLDKHERAKILFRPENKSCITP